MSVYLSKEARREKIAQIRAQLEESVAAAKAEDRAKAPPPRPVVLRNGPFEGKPPGYGPWGHVPGLRDLAPQPPEPADV